MPNHAALTPIKKVDRWVKGNEERSMVDQPSMVKNYNLNMGGVDLLDRNLANQRPQMRSKNRNCCLFSNCLSICVFAAWKVGRELGNN